MSGGRQVRELKALRTGTGAGAGARAGAGPGAVAGCGGGDGGSGGGGTGSGGDIVAADGSEAAAEAADLKSREVELWEKVRPPPPLPPRRARAKGG